MKFILTFQIINMSISKRFFSFLVLSIVAASCAYRSDIPDYAHPEILDTSAEVGDTDIILTSNVSDRAGIKECGFSFGEDKDNMTMYLSELSSDDAFSLTLRNVPRGKTYYFRSFISGGEDTRMSGTQAIDFSYKAPRVSIDSLITIGLGGVEYEFSVKDDQSVIGQRIVYPLFQLRFGGAHTGGVVGKAQVDHIRSLLRQIGHKAVLLCAGHIDKVAVKAVGVLVAAAAVHGVGVHIHRVHRVTHSDLVVYAEQVADIAAVGLGAVRDEDLVVGDVDPASVEILLRDD